MDYHEFLFAVSEQLQTEHDFTEEQSRRTLKLKNKTLREKFDLSLSPFLVAEVLASESDDEHDLNEKVLLGYNSIDNAYIQEGNFFPLLKTDSKLRCRSRFWVEREAVIRKKQSRFIYHSASQTTNKKWNYLYTRLYNNEGMEDGRETGKEAARKLLARPWPQSSLKSDCQDGGKIITDWCKPEYDPAAGFAIMTMIDDPHSQYNAELSTYTLAKDSEATAFAEVYEKFWDQLTEELRVSAKLTEAEHRKLNPQEWEQCE